MSDRDRDRDVQLRAERIQKNTRSRRMGRAAQNLNEHLRRMDEQTEKDGTV